jgi:hypothetical protein
MRKSEADCTNQLIMFVLSLWLRKLALSTKISMMTVFTIPELGKSLRIDTCFMKGSKTVITAVEFTFFLTLKAMVIIELVFINHFFLVSNN